MRNGQVYICKNCGIELKVMNECKDFGSPSEDCECPPCKFICCGEELELKE
jgi:hypothetical protein